MRRKLEELNLLDDFLFQELISRGKKGEEVCRILLSTILGKNIRNVKVTPQKPILGANTDLHGIRMDAYIEAADESVEVDVSSDIYDIEPNTVYEKSALPKRTRYYQSLIDSKLLESGADYETLKNVFIIMILPYDPFDKNRMIYTIQNCCTEDNSLAYEDGVTRIFLYTKGTQNIPSQKLKEMLKYMENSIAENVTNHELAAIHNYVNEVKYDREVGIQYMKSWERDSMMKKEGLEEGFKKGIKAVILNMLNRSIPDEDIRSLAGCTKELIDEVRQENNLS